MSRKTNQNESECDLLWGAANIGRAINQSAAQTRHLHAAGKLRGAVKKVGHKTLVGSRERLRQLFFPDQATDHPQK